MGVFLSNFLGSLEVEKVRELKQLVIKNYPPNVGNMVAKEAPKVIYNKLKKWNVYHNWMQEKYIIVSFLGSIVIKLFLKILIFLEIIYLKRWN